MRTFLGIISVFTSIICTSIVYCAFIIKNIKTLLYNVSSIDISKRICIGKRDAEQPDDKKVLDACHAGDKTADEIIGFIWLAAKKQTEGADTG